MALLLSIALMFTSAPETVQARRCSLDSMSVAEKQALTTGYYKVLREQGQAHAEQWVKAQGKAYGEKLVAEGVCPRPATTAGNAEAPPEEPQLRNRRGEPCKRIELENQNVPNLGGAMGWALLPVCKDD